MNAFMDDSSNQQLLAAISQLKTACDWHEQWYKNVLRSLVARVPPRAEDMAADAYLKCPFGRWYQGAGGSVLADDQHFSAINTKHQKMHALASALLQKVAADLPVSLDEWEGYQAAVDDMRHDLHCLQSKLSRKAQERDHLTGAFNRAVLEADLREQDAAVKRGIATCAFAMLDLDHFKAVNDNFGHAAGDAVLAATVQCVKSVLRPYDRVYRYGGEEFLIAMPGVTSTQAVHLAERIREAIAQQHVRPDDTGICIQVTGSIGVAMHLASRSVEDSLHSADKAMYQAKAQGRNRVVLVD